MNILVINWRDIKHPRAGGAEVRLHHVYEPMAARDHTVTLITCRFDGCADHEMINGVSVHRFGSDATFAPIVFFNLKKWVKQFGADIVVEDFNKLPFLSPLVSPVPVMIQMHHLWLKSIFREASFAAALLVWGTEQLIRPFYRKERFCVVSESTKRELCTYGVAPDQIEIIYNGVDLEFYTPASEPYTGKPFLFWLGRLQKYKGILDACEAFAQIAEHYPDLTLKVAGNGPFKEDLKAWIAEHNLESRIELLGFISEEQKLQLLRDAYAVIQSSYKEGWGLTVIEANACGTPVIANNAPGLCDSVRHDQTGLLYDFGSVESLTQTLSAVLADRSIRDRLATNARPWAERFDWATPSIETENLLKSILKL